MTAALFILECVALGFVSVGLTLLVMVGMAGIFFAADEAGLTLGRACFWGVTLFLVGLATRGLLS